MDKFLSSLNVKGCRVPPLGPNSPGVAEAKVVVGAFKEVMEAVERVSSGQLDIDPVKLFEHPQVQQLFEQITSLTKLQQAGQEELRVARDNLNDQNEKVRWTNEKWHDAQKEALDLEGKMHDAQQEVLRLEKRLGDLEHERDDVARLNEDLVGDLGAAHAKIKKLKDERGDLKENDRDNSDRIQRLNNRIDDLNGQVGHFRELFYDKCRAYQQANNARNIFNQNLVHRTNPGQWSPQRSRSLSLQQSEEILSNLPWGCAANNMYASDLTSYLGTREKETAETLEKTQADLHRALGKIDIITKEKNELKTQLEQADKRIGELEDDIGDLEDKLCDKREKIDKLEKKLDKKRRNR